MAREATPRLIDEERIVTPDVPRFSPDVARVLLAIDDMCSTISDVLDELGVGAAVGGDVLAPVVPGARVCGPAITIRYGSEGGNVGARLARGERARLADRDLYALGREGDVAVFDCGGVRDASVMGGLSAHWAQRSGIAGCVVDGAVRDLSTLRATGVGVWAGAVTPRTGKHRVEAVEINGRVTLAGVVVSPGDLVAADETGVCFVPAAAVAEVVECCGVQNEKERAVMDGIRAGMSLDELSRILAADRW